jgi:hypothetical protein
MPRVDINVAGASAADLLTALKELYPKRLPRRIVRTIIPANERLLDRLVDEKLRPYPPRVRHSPFVWSRDPQRNARARRWWFANRNGPHQRTGALGRAWTADVTYAPAETQINVSVGNTSPGASYVIGAAAFDYAQVPSHAATGWVNIGTQGANVVLEVSIQIENDLRTVIDEELRRLK